MSLEAVWTVRFGPEGVPERELNGGVAIIETGRVFGGDSGYAYMGTIEASNEEVTGFLIVKRHDPRVGSMYDLDEDEIRMSFRGRMQSPDRIVGRLSRGGFPDAKLVLTRFTELP